MTFDDDVTASGALTKLKGARRAGVSRKCTRASSSSAPSTAPSPSRTGSADLTGAASGGLLGLLVGILGGPVGVLTGGSYRLLIGSLFDLSDGERIESTLGQLSESVQPERTAVLAVVTEPSPEVIDAAMPPFDGTVLRRSVYEVEAEVAAPPRGRAQRDP